MSIEGKKKLWETAYIDKVKRNRCTGRVNEERRSRESRKSREGNKIEGRESNRDWMTIDRKKWETAKINIVKRNNAQGE